MLVRVDLSRILIREMTDTQFITLEECDGTRAFPIAIGLPEAFAIERRLRKIEAPRPQTHDLLSSVVGQMGGLLKRIIIHSLEDGTFFANIVIEQDGEEIEIDSRPSDAIALGVAEDVPMYVEETVLTEASQDATAEGAQGDGEEESMDWSSDMDEDEDDEDSWL